FEAPGVVPSCGAGCLQNQLQGAITGQGNDLSLAIQAKPGLNLEAGVVYLADHEALDHAIATGLPQPALACKHSRLVGLQIFGSEQAAIEVVGSLQASIKICI